MSTTDLPPSARTVVERLAGLDRERPSHDRVRAEEAFREHFRALRLKPLPVHWELDAELGYLAASGARDSPAWSRAAGSAAARVQRLAGWHTVRELTWHLLWTPAEGHARNLAENEAWLTAVARNHGRLPSWLGARTVASGAAKHVAGLVAAGSNDPLTPRTSAARLREPWRPFVDLLEAGVWLFWPIETAVIAVPRPAVRTAFGALHCDNAPAVEWTGGAHYYFLHGDRVSAALVARPEAITTQDILRELNPRIRRDMLRRIGHDRFLRDVRARPVQVDRFGALYRIPLPSSGDEPLTLVRVLNSTPEPDGTRKPYFLEVPPTVTTPREAVAWTFGLSADEYDPARET